MLLLVHNEFIRIRLQRVFYFVYQAHYFDAFALLLTVLKNYLYKNVFPKEVLRDHIRQPSYFPELERRPVSDSQHRDDSDIMLVFGTVEVMLIF